MTDIPEAGIKNLLGIIEESKSSLEKEFKINYEFKVDFSNFDHDKYLSSCVIIALLRSAVNNTPNVEENIAKSSSSSITTHDIRKLCLDIDRITKQDNTVTSFEDLQKRIKRNKTILQDKRARSVVLEYAIENENLNVIKFPLGNGVTIINVIGHVRYYVSKIGEDKSILCSVVSYTNDNNAENLNTLLQSVNAEQSKLNRKDELYRLYQQLKNDAF